MLHGSLQPRKRPAYAINSVDNALRLAALLQLQGHITVTEAAQVLDVAPSTAHRLLAMLVYREFAVHSGHTYFAGPLIAPAEHDTALATRLRPLAYGPMSAVRDATGETVTLGMLIGATVRFVAEVEGADALRVGPRAGMVFAAHRISSGLAMLAAKTDAEVRALYAAAPEAEQPDWSDLEPRLASARRAGYAVNRGLSERGVFALGCVLRGAGGAPVAGISVAMPEIRFDPSQLRSHVALLTRATADISAALAASDVHTLA